MGTNERSNDAKFVFCGGEVLFASAVVVAMATSGSKLEQRGGNQRKRGAEKVWRNM